MVEYNRLRLNPVKYGKTMTEKEAIEVMEMLMPKLDVIELRELTKEELSAGNVNSEQVQLWVQQHRLWQAFEAFLENNEMKY